MFASSKRAAAKTMATAVRIREPCLAPPRLPLLMICARQNLRSPRTRPIYPPQAIEKEVYVNAPPVSLLRPGIDLPER